MNSLLSTAYFPNIQYISKFVKSEKVFIEIFETYPKQTYRNRCNILSANGIQSLSVPVVKNYHTFTKDIKIDYSVFWQRNHRTAIMSAYKNSPYYEYYYYRFEPFFIQKDVFLLDYNTKILSLILKILGLPENFEFTNDYVSNPTMLDYRDSINPKQSKNLYDAEFVPKKYIQVFSDRFDFISNLSVLDLIFNEGPNAGFLLT